MPYNYLFLVILGPAILLLTDGCGRIPATPKPTTPSVTTVATHRLPCTENETTMAACLNGGECFVILLEDRTTSCQCPEFYIGKHCQWINPEIAFQGERDQQIETAGIAASAVAAVLFVVVVLCIVIFHKRYKRRKKKDQDQKSHNGLLVNTNNTNSDHVNDQNDSIEKEDEGDRCLINGTTTDIESCV